MRETIEPTPSYNIPLALVGAAHAFPSMLEFLVAQSLVACIYFLLVGVYALHAQGSLVRACLLSSVCS